jgi:hypothetical protein
LVIGWRLYRSIAARMSWQYYLAERNGNNRMTEIDFEEAKNHNG